MTAYHAREIDNTDVVRERRLRERPEDRSESTDESVSEDPTAELIIGRVAALGGGDP
jgi:hypothetical protein